MGLFVETMSHLFLLFSLCYFHLPLRVGGNLRVLRAGLQAPGQAHPPLPVSLC